MIYSPDYITRQSSSVMHDRPFHSDTDVWNSVSMKPMEQNVMLLTKLFVSDRDTMRNIYRCVSFWLLYCISKKLSLTKDRHCNMLLYIKLLWRFRTSSFIHFHLSLDIKGKSNLRPLALLIASLTVFAAHCVEYSI